MTSVFDLWPSMSPRGHEPVRKATKAADKPEPDAMNESESAVLRVLRAGPSSSIMELSREAGLSTEDTGRVFQRLEGRALARRATNGFGASYFEAVRRPV